MRLYLYKIKRTNRGSGAWKLKALTTIINTFYKKVSKKLKYEHIKSIKNRSAFNLWKENKTEQEVKFRSESVRVTN